MGFFSNLFSGAKELTKISNGVTKMQKILDEYEKDPDVSCLYIAAWIGRIAIIDVIEKNNYPLTYTLFVPIKGHQTRMTLYQAHLLSVGRLSIKIGTLNDTIKSYILDILDKGDSFYEIDKQLPQSTKDLFL